MLFLMSKGILRVTQKFMTEQMEIIMITILTISVPVYTAITADSIFSGTVPFIPHLSCMKVEGSILGEDFGRP